MLANFSAFKRKWMKRSEKSEGCAILLTEIHVMNGEVNGREKVYK